ncbi:MAG: hypothetical protein E7616_03265 [Ruminococcaceae bacterium]|nr:hypothetical protein [Oscillospiraceae bacterium]
MKKTLIALLLMLLSLAVMVSCGGDKNTEEPQDPDTEQNETVTDEEDSSLGEITAFNYGAYFISNAANNNKLGLSEDGKVYTINNTGSDLLTLYPVTSRANASAHYICFGDEADTRLAMENPLPGKEPKIQSRKSSNAEQFVFHKQADGTYIIRTAMSDKTVLAYENGKIVNQMFDANNKNQYWNVEATEYPQTTYRQWVSDKGDIFLRLPLDVLETAHTSEEIMQEFANSIQKTYDAYIELTNYIPYPAIVVKGDEKQGVMAGVVDGCNTIFINVEWYVDDMAKLQQRWEAGKRDFNFCVLHEMGHMFDSGRGWNFESEMEADLKAVYVLYKHQNDDAYGAWAAPAEFGAKECFNYETIYQAYDYLGADMEVEYSFYGAAQLFTELVYETGWDALMKTFHRFQAENLTTHNLKTSERFNKFITYWNENTDVDVFTFIGSKKMQVMVEKFKD